MSVIELIKSLAKEKWISEAIYNGKEVPLNRIVPGDVKKSMVFVTTQRGTVKKKNFKQTGMRYSKKGKFKHICAHANNPNGSLYYDCKSFGDPVEVGDRFNDKDKK